MPANRQQALLTAEALQPHQVKAVRILALAFGCFEPLGFQPGLAMPMVHWMIEAGLAEAGLANEYTGKPGYRLTAFGHEVHAQLAQRRLGRKGANRR